MKIGELDRKAVAIFAGFVVLSVAVVIKPTSFDSCLKTVMAPIYKVQPDLDEVATLAFAARICSGIDPNAD